MHWAALTAWMRRREGLALWAFLGAWLTLGFRWLVMPAVGPVGLLDDAVLWSGSVLLGMWALGWRRWLRLGVLGVVGLAWLLFNLATVFYLQFFESLLNLDAWQLLAQAPAIGGSVGALLTPRTVTLHIAVPVVLLALSLWGYSHGRPRHAGAWSLPLALLTMAGLVVHDSVRAESFLAAEHNALLHVARQGFERLYLLHGERKDERMARIVASLGRTYPPPDSAQWRTGHNQDFPLLQEPLVPTSKQDKQLNVVIILMESFRLMETGIGRPGDALAPHLQELARHALYFPRFYANAHQTVRGEMATLCSLLPNFGGGQLYSAFQDVSVRCLPEILRGQGYETHWISSYASQYANKRGFLWRHGVQMFEDKPLVDKRATRPKVGWGASDMDLAEIAVDVLDGAHAPFFAEVMTLSNHHPFTYDYGIPTPPAALRPGEGQVYAGYLRGMHFTDEAVHHFLELAKARPWFQDTVFVILGDHGIWTFPEKGARTLTPAEKVEAFHRVPFIIHSPAHVVPKVDETLASQVDVAPTILDILGIRAANSFQGTSLMRPLPSSQRQVVMGNDSAWHIRQGDTYCYALGQSCFKEMSPACPPGVSQQAQAHACFTYPGELLDLAADRSGVKLLSEREGDALVARGTRVVEDSKFLLLHDAMYPRSLR